MTTSARLPLGWSIDQVWLGSGANGTSSPVDSTVGDSPTGTPAVTVSHEDRTTETLTVHGTGQPFWLVLGQSFSSGWRATAGGRSLGAPRLIDGYANGWYVPALAAGHTLVVHLEWQPQRVVWIAIGLSAGAVLLCLLLAVVSRRRRAGSIVRGGARTGVVVVLLRPGGPRTSGGLVVGAGRRRRVGSCRGGREPPGDRRHRRCRGGDSRSLARW